MSFNPDTSKQVQEVIFTQKLQKKDYPHFLLSCPNYIDEKLTLLSKIRNINPNILENANSQITQLFLYGDKNFTAPTNFVILSSTIEYILATKRFDEPLFH